MNSYVTLEITGNDTKRFITSLYKRNIKFYTLNLGKKKSYCTVSYQDYLKIKEIKTIYKIKIIKYNGLVKLKNLLSFHKIFILTIIFGVLLLFYLSNIVFHIEVINEKKEVREFIYNKLQDKGIRKFSIIKKFSEREKIINEILSENHDYIEWMELERIGCKYIVRVDVRKLVDEDNDDVARDVIAKKRGMIISINASKGEVVKKVNDYVEAGDVIISGTIMNKDQVKDYVSADGVVFAEVWYHVSVEVPSLYQEVNPTGKTAKNISLKFLTKERRILSNFTNFKDKELFSLSNTLLPISISIVSEEEIKVTDLIYSEDMAILKALDEARGKLATLIGKDDEIIYEKYLKKYEEDSKIVVDMFFKVKEDITSYMEIVPNLSE